MIILDVTGDLDVTGNISGTNGTFGGNIGAVNGNSSGTVTAGQYNGPLQYNVSNWRKLTGGFHSTTQRTELLQSIKITIFAWTGDQTWAGTSTFNGPVTVNTITGTTGTFTTLNATNFNGGAFSGTNGTFSGNVTVTGNVTAAGGIFDDIVVNNDADFRGTVINTTGNVLVDDNLDVTGDLDVTGNISGTNGTFGGNIGAVNGNFSGTVTAGQYNGPLQYNVQTGAGLTGGLFNNTANRIFAVDQDFDFAWTGDQTWAGDIYIQRTSNSEHDNWNDWNIYNIECNELRWRSIQWNEWNI